MTRQMCMLPDNVLSYFCWYQDWSNKIHWKIYCWIIKQLSNALFCNSQICRNSRHICNLSHLLIYNATKSLSVCKDNTSRHTLGRTFIPPSSYLKVSWTNQSYNCEEEIHSFILTVCFKKSNNYCCKKT